MRVALVHDYLYTYGGAERVLEAFHEIWPQVPVYTAWVDWQWLKSKKQEWQNWQIIPSWFDKIPFKKQLCSPLRFLTPWIWSSFDLSQYDVVISSSAWYMSKGVSLTKTLKLSNSKTLHVCYCHTPPRYLYGYETDFDWQRFWLTRMYANLVNPFMRWYDFKSSQKIDWFICNSYEVQKRIKKFYRREATIIYPPIFKHVGKVDKSRDKVENEYFLMVNRLVRPKNIDLAIRACKKLKLNLKIVGSGPDEKRLKKLAGKSQYVHFLGYVNDEKLAKIYLDCKAVLYLAENEDFGITPVEAMSFGKPVIALRSGGVQESVIEGKTGLFIDKLNFGQLIQAIKKLSTTIYRSENCLRQAEKFSKEKFKKEVKEFVAACFL